MRTRFLPLYFLLLSCLLAACGNSHFIKDADYRAKVEQDLELKKKQMPQGDLFAVLDTDLDTYEREALEFLYAYMPLADITDYPGEFHLMNVRASRQAADEMPWGGDIPEELFRHFVLPARVNNEHLDSARVVFYKELKDRVKQLSLHDAILEVNHWCHEKAVYQPSDARTSSPMATVRTAYGRCGEESTLLVAALRSVGIPARQVYTPRWAHTDDNHAWVEAWADGKWHFLGACEPEPVLDLGWFNAPASRGMLMHTKVFGRYEGPEEVMSVTNCYTEINVIDNYAPTARAVVQVVDAGGKPVPDAIVEFKLYNYAEFYTVARKQTDAEGKASLTAGKGDMLVWASKDGKTGFAKLSFGKDSELQVKLDKEPGAAFSVDLDIVPPTESANLPEVTPEQRAENDRRLAHEDSIRNAYTATFMTDEKAREFARLYRLDEDAAARILVASRGNHAVITNFMARLRSDKSKVGGFDLLQRISEKDLRDVTLDVLIDHMMSRLCTNADLYRRYVRNPRVSNEALTPYKAFFNQVVSEEEREAYVADPMKLVSWVSENIRVDKNCNLGASPISPAGVWKARLADPHSRDIFFVSMARSMGIPARIHDVTGKVQLVHENDSCLYPDQVLGQPEVLFALHPVENHSRRFLAAADLRRRQCRQCGRNDLGKPAEERYLARCRQLCSGHRYPPGQRFGAGTDGFVQHRAGTDHPHRPRDARKPGRRSGDRQLQFRIALHPVGRQGCGRKAESVAGLRSRLLCGRCIRRQSGAYEPCLARHCRPEGRLGEVGKQAGTAVPRREAGIQVCGLIVPRLAFYRDLRHRHRRHSRTDCRKHETEADRQLAAIHHCRHVQSRGLRLAGIYHRPWRAIDEDSAGH